MDEIEIKQVAQVYDENVPPVRLYFAKLENNSNLKENIESNLRTAIWFLLDPNQDPKNEDYYWMYLNKYANFYEKEKDYAKAEFYRWCVLEKYAPYIREKNHKAYWFRKEEKTEEGIVLVSGVDPSLLEHQTNIPNKYYQYLTGPEEANHRVYGSMFEAYDDLYNSWMLVE